MGIMRHGAGNSVYSQQLSTDSSHHARASPALSSSLREPIPTPETSPVREGWVASHSPFRTCKVPLVMGRLRVACRMGPRSRWRLWRLRDAGPARVRVRFAFSERWRLCAASLALRALLAGSRGRVRRERLAHHVSPGAWRSVPQSARGALLRGACRAPFESKATVIRQETSQRLEARAR